jgi:AAA15 family ATPase/GTPase
MAAGKYTKHKSHMVNFEGRNILKSSVFFGANASGKTNLFQAVNFANSIIKDGIKNVSLIENYYRVDSTYYEKPGVFQFDLLSNGHFYSYGFAISYSKAIVLEEWLILCDSNETPVFERSIENNETVVDSDFSFGNKNRSNQFRVYADNIAPDKLLLSEIAECKLINNQGFYPFKDVVNWFSNLYVLFPNTEYSDKIRFYSDDRRNTLIKLLKRFDTGIEDVTIKSGPLDEMLSFIPDINAKNEIKQQVEQALIQVFEQDKKDGEIQGRIGDRVFKFKKENGDIIASQMLMNHGNDNSLFNLSDESDGTRRLFDLIPIYTAAKSSAVILIDELDRSFHTKLAQNFINYYFNSTEGYNCQLIASVHDTNIMDLDLLRQDEIWFVERQEDHSSMIYSLSKYKERFDKKISKDYLLGRYGAIPCFSQFEEEEE